MDAPRSSSGGSAGEQVIPLAPTPGASVSADGDPPQDSVAGARVTEAPIAGAPHTEAPIAEALGIVPPVPGLSSDAALPLPPLTSPGPEGIPPARPARRKPSIGETFASLRIRDFRYLAISTLASGFAQWAKQLAIFALVYDMTGSAVQLGTVAAFRGIVGTALAPYGGYLSDRFSRRTVIVVSTLFDAVLAGVLAVLVLADQHEIWHIYVVALGGGLAQSINQPARQAFVYDITDDETMPNAIAVNSMVQNIARVLGPAGFGVMMAVWGIAASLITLLILQLLATVATLAVSRTTRQARLVAGSHALTMMREGFAYCWHDRRILGLVVASTIPSLLVFSYLPFLKVVSEDVLNRGNTGYGLLSSMGGWGSLVGLLALASMSGMQRRGWWMLGGYIGYAVLLIVFSWSANLYLSMATLVVAGVFFSISSTLNNTLLLQLSPSEMRGRVMAVNQMAHGVQPLGAFPMAFAVSAFGVQTGLGIFMVAATVAFVVFGLVWSSVRRL